MKRSLDGSTTSERGRGRGRVDVEFIFSQRVGRIFSEPRERQCNATLAVMFRLTISDPDDRSPRSTVAFHRPMSSRQFLTSNDKNTAHILLFQGSLCECGMPLSGCRVLPFPPPCGSEMKDYPPPRPPVPPPSIHAIINKYHDDCWYLLLCHVRPN